MGLFNPKADAAQAALEIARLTGENMALRMTVGVLLRHSPARDVVLEDMAQSAGALTSNVWRAGMHPMVRSAIEDTLGSLRRMA